MDIKNKVAIVTGGTGGIGFATVQALLKNDAKHVAMFDVESVEDRAIACLEKIEKEFGKGKASYHACDVTKASEFAELYDKILESQNTVDILINNAGILNEKDGDRMIDINVKGLVNCTLTAIERMGTYRKGNGGTILNLSSVAGLKPSPTYPIYSATKHAVYGFTTSLKEHYKNTGVRTLGICPGFTQTYLVEKDLKEICLPFIAQNFFDAITQIKRSVTVQPPENVAKAIIKMIKEGKNGDIWVTDDNEPPYALQEIPLYKNRKIPV